MAVQLVLFYYYLLLAGGVSVVSGFTPVTYPARVYPLRVVSMTHCKTSN